MNGMNAGATTGPGGLVGDGPVDSPLSSGGSQRTPETEAMRAGAHARVRVPHRDTSIPGPTEPPGGQAEPAGGGADGARGAAEQAAVRLWLGRVWRYLAGDLPGLLRELWNSSPPSPAQVLRYARAGEWCSAESTVIRLLGRGYAWLAVAVTVANHLVTSVVQRPGRVAAVAVLVFVVWIVL